MTHELTKLLYKRPDNLLNIDQIITAWAKERSEWLKEEMFWTSQAIKRIDQAFQINERTLEEKIIENYPDCNDSHIAHICNLARQHFIENPGDLK